MNECGFATLLGSVISGRCRPLDSGDGWLAFARMPFSNGGESMKRLMFVLALAVGLAAAPSARADSYTMSLSSTTYGEVSFSGGRLRLQYGVVRVAVLLPDRCGGLQRSQPIRASQPLVGMLGEITGTFTIGTIYPDSIGGEFASVTTSSRRPQFINSDGSGNNSHHGWQWPMSSPRT